MIPTRALTQSRYEVAEQFAQGIAKQSNRPLIFDIGAGPAPMKAPIEAAGARWTGFDLAPPRSDVLQWDLENPCPIAEKADAAIMLDVLEHLFNPALCLRNVVDALKPGAEILFTLPNPQYSRGRVHFLAKGTMLSFCRSDLEINHHVFVPLPHVVERLIVNSGLRLTDYFTIDFTPGWPRLSFRLPLELAASFLAKAIERTDAQSRGFSYAVRARKPGVISR